MRKYSQCNLLESTKFQKTASRLLEVFPAHSWCLIGGLAVAHYANPPVTVDVDILFDSHDYNKHEISEWMTAWKSRPLSFNTRLSGYPREGVSFSKNEFADADVLFTGKDKFLRSAVRDCCIMKVAGLHVPVIKIENLIVMKTLSGREKDEDDVATLYESYGDRLNASYINRKLERLG